MPGVAGLSARCRCKTEFHMSVYTFSNLSETTLNISTIDSQCSQCITWSLKHVAQLDPEWSARVVDMTYRFTGTTSSLMASEKNVPLPWSMHFLFVFGHALYLVRRGGRRETDLQNGFTQNYDD